MSIDLATTASNSKIDRRQSQLYTPEMPVERYFCL